MSNWLTLLLTERRSSARSAPISYTPPVKPPPPSTSAVRDCRARPARRRPPAAPFSSLTTLPMAPSVYGASTTAREIPVPGPDQHRPAAAEVAHGHTAAEHADQGAIAAVLDPPAGAADGRGGGGPPGGG